MRIWSIHPRYLDAKGLVALWRETLLAKNVLLGNTKGYQNHPQLNRFKTTANPSMAMDQYLAGIYEESIDRGYHFNRDKIDWQFDPIKIKVTSGQIDYEWQHLMKKLQIRDPKLFNQYSSFTITSLHPIFFVIDGPIEDWEVIT